MGVYMYIKKKKKTPRTRRKCKRKTPIQLCPCLSFMDDDKILYSE